MGDLKTAGGLDIDMVEALAKKHFGRQVTSRLRWDYIKGRPLPSRLPGWIGYPRKVLGLTLSWKGIGEFTDNYGFRLELWDPAYLQQAKALEDEYNATDPPRKMELIPLYLK